MKSPCETTAYGSGAQDIDVGSQTLDAFGDLVCVRKGDARSFPGLSVARNDEGRGASTCCQWIIEVPEGFKFMIRLVTNPGGDQRHRTYDVLYAPEEAQVRVPGMA